MRRPAVRPAVADAAVRAAGADRQLPAYRVERGRVEDPETRLGAAFFAALFEERPRAEDLDRFPASFAAGARLATHRHPGPVAACVTRGTMTFVFGADGTDVLDLGPGDYVWIRGGVMHDERVGQEGVEMVVAALEPVETIEA
jgi:quercetin dioxygenase-like cupin family protein